MLKNILRDLSLINEAKELKEDSFKYFYIEEIKDVDTIPDIEELGSRDNVEILLVTDQNYSKEDLNKNDWFKVKTEDLIKYIEKTVDKYEAGDYLDFMGGYGITDLIVNFLEAEYGMKHYKNWEDFEGVMEVNTEINEIKKLVIECKRHRGELNELNLANIRRATMFLKNLIEKFEDSEIVSVSMEVLLELYHLLGHGTAMAFESEDK